LPGEFGTFPGLIGRNEIGAPLLETELQNGSYAGLENRRLIYLIRLDISLVCVAVKRKTHYY
jgi:hypothetical protein